MDEIDMLLPANTQMANDVDELSGRLAAYADRSESAIDVNVFAAVAVSEIVRSVMAELSRPMTQVEFERAMDWWVTARLAVSTVVALWVGWTS